MQHGRLVRPQIPAIALSYALDGAALDLNADPFAACSRTGALYREDRRASCVRVGARLRAYWGRMIELAAWRRHGVLLTPDVQLDSQ
jgi:hypothetical protein